MGECKYILNLYYFFSFYFKRSITNAWLPIMTVLNIIVPAESSRVLHLDGWLDQVGEGEGGEAGKGSG